MSNKILIVAALEKEYPFNDLNVLYTGVGKINAAINLFDFLIKNRDINFVINVGTAGGINIERNKIIECGIFQDGQFEFPDYEEEIISFNESKAKILTFDHFILKKPNKDCQCVDMESFALAKVCKKLNLNFKCFKFITDIVGEKNQQNDWLDNMANGKNLLRKEVYKYVD
jgi:adenosylhomocysteine nucleosidase